MFKTSSWPILTALFTFFSVFSMFFFTPSSDFCCHRSRYPFHWFYYFPCLEISNHFQIRGYPYWSNCQVKDSHKFWTGMCNGPQPDTGAEGSAEWSYSFTQCWFVPRPISVYHLRKLCRALNWWERNIRSNYDGYFLLASYPISLFGYLINLHFTQLVLKYYSSQ